MLRRIFLCALRVTLAVVIVLAVLWWIGVRMPGKNVAKAAALSREEVDLRGELKAAVEELGGGIGERNMSRYGPLLAAGGFIEESLTRAGLHPRRDTYDMNGRACYNIEAEIRGSSPQIVLVGAHYDSVLGAPGANDNGSGIAAMLALAQRFAKRSTSSTLRFVAFVNEEPPYFQTPQMGSLVYAKGCKTRGDQISAMISLETIGYFSDAPNSQTYPAPGLGLFYPKTANFIAFVGNVASRDLLRRALGLFREQAKIPSQGAALPASIPGIAWSDHWAFWEQGYPAIMVTDTAPFRYPHYHTSTDTPDKLDYDRFALVVSGMEKVIANLAGTSP